MADSERVKMTLMLDSDTIAILKKYAYEKLGDTNVSKAVRVLAKEHEERQNK